MRIAEACRKVCITAACMILRIGLSEVRPSKHTLSIRRAMTCTRRSRLRLYWWLFLANATFNSREFTLSANVTKTVNPQALHRGWVTQIRRHNSSRAAVLEGGGRSWPSRDWSGLLYWNQGSDKRCTPARSSLRWEREQPRDTIAIAYRCDKSVYWP